MEQTMPGSFSRRDIDIVIVGGGVVGCAMARRFTLEGAKVLLIERAPDILAGASKGNSAILHTGFDAEPQSLELKCMRDGHAEYLAIRQRLGLPLLETGAMVVAWSPDELARLQPIFETAQANGVTDVEILAPEKIYAREPHLAPGALGAVLVSGEHIIDPWSAPLAYLRQAVSNGAELRRGTELTAAKFLDGAWQLQTTTGPLSARWLINCAGLWGDKVEQLALGKSSFTIKPRKGQFIVLDKAAAASLRTTLLPVPTERTKGIVLCRTIFGNVLVGPTAEETDERDIATADHDVLQRLVAHAAKLVPAFSEMPVTSIYAGLRPATELKQYRIDCHPDQHYIAAGGIRSTGLTSALGIARHVFDLYTSAGNPHDPIAEPRWPVVPNLADHEARDFAKLGYGEIVCHCESVTRREIEQALEGDLGAKDIGGLKRRTRAMMGRCQGFYCAAAVAAIADEHLAVPLSTGTADEH
jgi:glycerol-3-phosphate dehydrogenase